MASSTHLALVQWVTEMGGFFHPNIEITHSLEKGFFVTVRTDKTVSPLTRIASCPMPATLSVLNAMDIIPFSCRGTRFPQAFLNKQTSRTVQSFFLMEQYTQGSNSWWAPYIATLPSPQDMDDFGFSQPSDLQWLEGTNLKAAFETQSLQWREMYADGIDQLRALNWPSATKNFLTWELFQWAATIFGSRSFTSQVLSDTLPADQARPIGHTKRDHENLSKLFSDGFPVLLPLLDLLNHKPFAHVEWQARYSFVGLQVLDDFEEGQELCNNYGPRDNETLLLGYGFVICMNPFDHFSVALKIAPESPLTAVRSWRADQKADSELQLYIFNANHPQVKSKTQLETCLFSVDLLESISSLSANDRELQVMFYYKKSLIRAALAKGKFENRRNILATISQLQQECWRRLAVLRSTDPRLSHPQAFPATPKQKNASIYRDSQMSILETAVGICSYILVRASSSTDNEPILTTLPATTCENAIRAIEILVNEKTCWAKPKELLDVQSLLKMLSSDLAQQISQSLDTIGEQQMQAESNPIFLDRGQRTKMKLAIILSALKVQYGRAEALPQRLKSWIIQLSQWYPPDDPNWSFVPNGSPNTPDEAPPPALMKLLELTKVMAPPVSTTRTSTPPGKFRWLTLESLCWGWNVMEEEAVWISSSLIHPHIDRCSLSSEQEALLYCPQL